MDIVNRLGNVCLWVSFVIYRIWVIILFIIVFFKMERISFCMEIFLNFCDNFFELGFLKVSVIEILSYMVDIINVLFDMFIY